MVDRRRIVQVLNNLPSNAARHSSELYLIRVTAVRDGVHYPQRKVTLAGRPAELTVIEYRMLVELSANAGWALTHEHLMQLVWKPDKGEDSGPVRSIVRRLRRKLGEYADNPKYILTEPSVGYRMENCEGQEQR